MAPFYEELRPGWAGWRVAPLLWENGTHGAVFTMKPPESVFDALVRMIEQVDDGTS